MPEKPSSKAVKPKPGRKTKISLLRRIENLLKKSESHKAVNKKEIEKHSKKVKATQVIGSPQKLTSLTELEKKIQAVHKNLKTAKTDPKKEIQKLKDIAVEVKKHRIVTDFDRVMFNVNKNKKISANKIARDLSIDKKRVEECATILEEAGLIEIEYPLVGSIALKIKGYKQKKKNKKK